MTVDVSTLDPNDRDHEEIMSTFGTKRWVGMSAGALAAVMLTSGAAVAQPALGEIRNTGVPESIPGSYIVMLHDAMSTESVTGLADRYDAQVSATYKSIPAFSVKMSELDARELAADPAVAFVEQDQIVTTSDSQTYPPSWGLDRIDQRDLPLSEEFDWDVDGFGVNAYILDTGIRIGHIDFEGRARYGRDTVDDDNVAHDCNGHGTHVAGTVGSKTFGVAKDVSLIAVRVIDCNAFGTISNAIQGIDWVTSDFQASGEQSAVANMSISGNASDSLDAAVRASIVSGITYVVAAGNNNASACGNSPARVTEAITVGASTNTDSRLGGTNYGGCVDVFAPGKDIMSAYGRSNTDVKTLSGTSMASPHVAGVAAMYLEKNPAGTAGATATAIVKHSTKNRLTGIGSGSPNRLLYRLVGPIIKYLTCSTALNHITCSTAVGAGEAPLAITWRRNGISRPDLDGRTYVVESCATGSSVTMEVTVTDNNGDRDSRSTTIICSNKPQP